MNNDDGNENNKPLEVTYLHICGVIPFTDKGFDLTFKMKNLDVIRNRPTFFDVLMGLRSSDEMEEEKASPEEMN